MRNRVIIFCLGLWVFQAHSAPYSAQALLADINAYRAMKGLSQLKMNDVLSREAVVHSNDMVENKIPFGHDGFNQRTHRIFDQFKHTRAIAENVAYTDFGTKSLVRLWLNSPAHRKNIEGNYNLTGIGIASDNNGRDYATQIFLKTPS
jgi:uncharacterized protein YkwD